MTSTQGYFGKEAKRHELTELAFLLSNDNKIKCFTADRKTVFTLSSVVLVCVSNSELLLEYCHIIFQWLGFIRIEQCFTLGLEIEIISFVLFIHGVRTSLRQSLLRRKKLQLKEVGYGPFPFRVSLSHYILEFLSHVAC